MNNYKTLIRHQIRKNPETTKADIRRELEETWNEMENNGELFRKEKEDGTIGVGVGSDKGTFDLTRLVLLLSLANILLFFVTVGAQMFLGFDVLPFQITIILIGITNNAPKVFIAYCVYKYFKKELTTEIKIIAFINIAWILLQEPILLFIANYF